MIRRKRSLEEREGGRGEGEGEEGGTGVGSVWPEGSSFLLLPSMMGLMRGKLSKWPVMSVLPGTSS